MKINIDRDQAARFGIQPAVIDATLNDAFGQQQATQYFTQLDSYSVIIEATPDLQKHIGTLDQIYVKSPISGQAIPLSTFVSLDTKAVGPLSVSHQAQFPAVTISFNLQPGVSLGEAVQLINQASVAARRALDADRQLPGQCAGVPERAVERAGADRGGAVRGLCHPRRAL